MKNKEKEQKERIYIAPNHKGEINGTVVTAKLLSLLSLNSSKLRSTCDVCRIKDKGICFKAVKSIVDGKDSVQWKQSATRPACMANDVENLCNEPLYYV